MSWQSCGKKKRERIRLEGKDCVIPVMLQNQLIISVIHYLGRLVWVANWWTATEF